MTKAFMIRGQSGGVDYTRVFLKPPTREQLTEALRHELRNHGFDNSGKPKKRWVRVHVIELLEGGGADENVQLEGILSEADLKKMFEEAPPGQMLAGVGEVVAQGTGKVLNPGDPGWVDGREEKAARMADQDARAKEAIAEREAKERAERGE